jgi:hypothetical protein
MHRRTALIAAGSAALVTITAGAAFATGHDDASPEVRPTTSSVAMPTSTVARPIAPTSTNVAARPARSTPTTSPTTVEDRNEPRGRVAEGEAPRGQDGARDVREAQGDDDRAADHSGPGRGGDAQDRDARGDDQGQHGGHGADDRGGDDHGGHGRDD